MRPLSVLALLFLPAIASAVPMELNHQGRLMDSTGAPLTGSHDISFSLFDADATGTQLWSETLTLDFDNGFYSTLLGADSTNALDDTLFEGDLWLELAVDGGTPFADRSRLVSVPFARKAGGVAGGIVDASEIRINGTTIIDSDGNIDGASLPGGDGDTLAELGCTNAGEVAQFDGLDWVCAPNPPAHEHDGSEITSGVLDIARIPIGTSATDAAAGDHLHALSQLTGKIADSQLPVGIESTVEGYITNGAIDLASGSTIGGAALADASHTHPAGDADTLDGNDSTAFATSGHTHSVAFSDLTGKAVAAQLPVGTGASDVAAGNHSHVVAFSDLTGKAVATQLPVGTGASDVAAGNHNHSGTYANASHTHAVSDVTSKSWTLVAQENYSQGASGWSNNNINTCGYRDRHLGGYGYFANGAVSKTFTGLPAHSEIKVEFEYHFIDSWDGESGYFDIDSVRKWSMARGGAGSGEPNICGGGWGDMLGYPVEVTSAHTASSVVLRVGSTLNQAATDESWGMDNLRVYVR